MKPYRKEKLFPHHLYVAQCSCCSSHLVTGARVHGHFVTPWAPLGQGWARGALVASALPCSPWHLEILLKDSLDDFELGGRDISSKLL